MGTTVPEVLGAIAEDEAQFMACMAMNNGQVLEDPDLDDLWNQLSLCLRVHRRAEWISLMSRPLIGKFLLAARDHPMVYQSRGFANYSEFIKVYVCGKMKLSRSALYEVRMIADRLPSLTPEKYVELGPTKALTLAKFSKSSDPSFEKYLEEANSRSATEFIAWATKKKYIEAGEQCAAVLVIQCDQLTLDMWNEFVALPAVQSFCGSANQGTILKSALQECRSSWVEYEDPNAQA